MRPNNANISAARKPKVSKTTQPKTKVPKKFFSRTSGRPVKSDSTDTKASKVLAESSLPKKRKHMAASY